jgi:predicted NBD/HSP70 family sugar kinase
VSRFGTPGGRISARSLLQDGVRLERSVVEGGFRRYDVPAHVSAGLGGPLLVDNDVNIMALGERQGRDRHRRRDHQRGRLHREAQGAAGDLGHVAAPHGGDALCTCGNIGCLEAIASGPAIVRRLTAEGVKAKDSRGLIELVRAGDRTAANAVRQAGRELGEVLATCVSMLNPSVIVVGGLLAQSSESLLAGVREVVVYGRSLPLATGELQIVTSRTGDHAGVIGAATMVIQHALSADQIEVQLARSAS